MAVKNDLIAKIQAHEARVGIVGLGYVGLPLVLRFGEEHFPVLGFDVDPAKVRKLQAGESYIRHIPADRLRVLINEKQFEATTDFQRLAEADCIIICDGGGQKLGQFVGVNGTTDVVELWNSA